MARLPRILAVALLWTSCADQIRVAVIETDAQVAEAAMVAAALRAGGAVTHSAHLFSA